MCFLFGLVVIVNAMSRSSELYMNKMIHDTYKTSSLQEGIENSMQSILYLPGAIASTIIYNKYSLKTGIMFGVLFQTVGSCFKLLLKADMVYFMFIGQAFWSIAYPFIIIPTTLVSLNWFEDSKRVLMISILVTWWFFGSVLGNGLSSIIVEKNSKDQEDNKETIFKIYTFLASASAAIFLLVVFTFRSRPRNPPSSAAVVYRDDDILGTYRALYKNRQFRFLCLSHTFYFALIPAIYLSRIDIIKPYGYTQEQADRSGFISISWGLVGSLLCGLFLHKTKMYKTANILIGLFLLIANATMIGALRWWYIAFTINLAVIGFFGFPITTIWYAYACEIAYPLKETTVTGVYTTFGEVFGIGIGYISVYLARHVEGETGSVLCLCVIIFSLLIGTICAFMMKPIEYEEITSSQISKPFFIKFYFSFCFIYGVKGICLLREDTK